MKKLKQSALAKTIATIIIAVCVCVLLVLPFIFDFHIINDFASTVLCILTGVFCFVFLMYSAGHTKNTENVVPNVLDKIPFDVYTGIVLAIISLILNIIYSIDISSLFALVCMVGLFAVLVIICISVCTSIAIRLKTHSLFTNTVIYKLGTIIFSVIKQFSLRVIYINQNIPLVWKTVIFLFFFYMFEAMIFSSYIYYNPQIYYIFRLTEQIIFSVLLLVGIISFKKLLSAGQKLADGNIEYKVDTTKMFSILKKHGDNLNNISAGISKAVDQQMKSERFKTELITNVSHDIKTPLTSIINYVDLIKKEDLDNPEVMEYIAVLDRQSAKLKKLIEDLVEASKASTGNIAVHAENTALGVLLTQTVGEYSEKAQQSQLELILGMPEEEIYIFADGRLMWRIFDNLLSNICKYALNATRVYLNLEKMDNKAVITFRNISKYPLNITSEALMERFVRGDSSRNTEGSGLGLSIAKSLTELQNGSFDLYVDGDLFKVVIKFDISKTEAISQ